MKITDVEIDLPSPQVFVALHQRSRGGDPPSVFVNIADIIAVAPDAAYAMICARGIPVPIKVDETCRQVMAAVYRAIGQEAPEHLGLDKDTAAVGNLLISES